MVFMGELYELSCCPCDIGNAFLYGKTKKKVYIVAGPEVGSNLDGKILIIDKSLYGLHGKECRHSRLLFRWKYRILHLKLHSEI
jgi:hypothetical protein